MLTIEVPNAYQNEKKYIISVVFKEFLGLDYQLTFSSHKETRIIYDNKELVISEGLFNTPKEFWLEKSSLPKLPLNVWNIDIPFLQKKIFFQQVPVIYGDDPKEVFFFNYSDNSIHIGLDIFGTMFFMLTRYEEFIIKRRDIHQRFSAISSLLEESLIRRPVVNEYLEILWNCIKYLWPFFERKERNFKVYLSHDVDRPFKYYLKSPRELLYTLKNEILRKKYTSVFESLEVKLGNLKKDPFNTFDKIMDLSEKNNFKSAFYFLTNTNTYSISNPLIRKLLREIYARGHEIGFHASYDSYLDPFQTRFEFEKLKDICEKEGIRSYIWGGRQHYLRWESPITWQNWNDAGLSYDSTLAYYDHIGFRCGVCYEYTTFNVETRTHLKLVERPLIVMDCTLWAYMNLSNEESLIQVENLIKQCKFYNGDFTLLWHNSSFEYESLYESLLGIITQ